MGASCIAVQSLHEAPGHFQVQILLKWLRQAMVLSGFPFCRMGFDKTGLPQSSCEDYWDNGCVLSTFPKNIDMRSIALEWVTLKQIQMGRTAPKHFVLPEARGKMLPFSAVRPKLSTILASSWPLSIVSSHHRGCDDTGV